MAKKILTKDEEKELIQILYTRQVNYEIMYLMWQACRGQRKRSEFEERFGMSKTTRHNITNELNWECDKGNIFQPVINTDKMKKISFRQMALRTSIEPGIFTGEKRFELDDFIDEQTIKRYLCFKRKKYIKEHRKECNDDKAYIIKSLFNAKLDFAKHPNLWRLRTFCDRVTTKEIITKFEVVNELISQLNVHTVREFSAGQKEELKELLPKLRTFCDDMETIIKYEELLKRP